MDRSKMYLGYIQFFMIIFVFLKVLGNNRFTEFIASRPIIAIPVLFIAFVFVLVVLGRLELKSGLTQEEKIRLYQYNPISLGMIASLKNIEETVERIEKKHGK